jgi:O-antigen ligase
MSQPRVIVSSLAAGLAAFLLYTNLLVVLAQSGPFPTAIAALVPGLLLVAVLHRVVVRREPLIVDRTFLLMLAFLAVLLASAFGARGQEVAAARIATYCVEGLVTYFLVRNAIHCLPELRATVMGVLAACVLLSVLSVYQTVTGNYQQEFLGLAGRSLEHVAAMGLTPAEVMGMEDRAYGPVGDPNRFAQLLMMGLPLAFVGMLNTPRGLARKLALGCVLAIVGGIVVTYSRGAFVALIVLGALAVPMRLARLSQVTAVFLAGAIAIPLAAPAYAGRVLSISGVAALFGARQVEADGATRGRTTEMLAALAAYTDHAVIGVGPGQYVEFYSVHYQSLPEISIREISEPRRAHSLYLELAAESGTIGLVIFMAIPLLLLRDLRAIRLILQRRHPDLARVAAGFSLLLLAYLGTGVFLHLAFERYFWFMIGLTAAAAGVLGRSTGAPPPGEEQPAWPRRASWV